MNQLSKVVLSRGVASLAVLVLALGLGAPLAAQEGADTPQAVFAAAQKASAAKDYAGIVRLVAPSERAMLAFATDMGVDMMSSLGEGESAKKLGVQYQELKKKYKVSEPPEGEELQVGPNTTQEEIDRHVRARAEKMYSGIDLPGYVGALVGLIAAMPEMADQPLVPKEPLGEVKVTGDHATAKAGDRDLHFVREGGRWYLTSQLVGG